jgi:hypothetical protein
MSAIHDVDIDEPAARKNSNRPTLCNRAHRTHSQSSKPTHGIFKKTSKVNSASQYASTGSLRRSGSRLIYQTWVRQPGSRFWFDRVASRMAQLTLKIGGKVGRRRAPRTRCDGQKKHSFQRDGLPAAPVVISHTRGHFQSGSIFVRKLRIGQCEAIEGQQKCREHRVGHAGRHPTTIVTRSERWLH